MVDQQIMLSATWVVVTLIYLYGDVLAHLQRRLAKSMADMEMCSLPVRLAGNRRFDVDPDPDGFPDPGIAPVGESLGRISSWPLLFPVQPGWPAHLSIVI